MAGIDQIVSAGGDFLNSFVWILIIGVLILLGYFIIAKGLFASRKYTVILNRKRGGGVKREIFKGRFIKSADKDEQFEIAINFLDRLIVAPPPEDVIAEGNIIEGVNQGENEVRWCKPGISESGEADLRPILPEGARTAWGVVFKSNFERKHQLSKWAQMLPSGLVFMGCLIVAFAIWMGYQEVAKSNSALVASNQAFAERLMSNSTIVIQKQTSPTSYITQPSNAPPG